MSQRCVPHNSDTKQAKDVASPLHVDTCRVGHNRLLVLMHLFTCPLLTHLSTAGAAVDPRRVIVQKLVFQPQNHAPVELDLTGDLALLKDKSKSVCIKEGCIYNLALEFRVQHEVVSGLRYVSSVYRKGVRGKSLQ